MNDVYLWYQIKNMEKINVQARDSAGNIIEIAKDIKDITEAIEVKIRFEKMYSKTLFMVSIHFIYLTVKA